MAFLVRSLVMCVVISQAYAGGAISLVCTNPRRDYLVNYTQGTAALELRTDDGVTLYPILEEGEEVRAEVPGAELTAVLKLLPTPVMEFWLDGHPWQIDPCRYSIDISIRS